MADLRTAKSIEQAMAMLDEKINQLDRRKRQATEVFKMTTNTNSATWTTATKVVTNLAGTFTAVKDTVYRAYAKVHVVNGTANTEALMIAIKAGGAVTATDTGDTPSGVRTLAGGAIVTVMLSQKFTATADGTYGVGVLGWKPTLDPNAANLFGAAYAVNELWVEIVA